jgi:hypothetical protein
MPLHNCSGYGNDHSNPSRTVIGQRQPNPRMQSDRFAREIGGILALFRAARLRRLMRKTLGRKHQRSV